ncbi:NUDIX domain-containing protein [Rhodococcus sp. PvR099]|jgi:8-oxo-dGTP pyrophosphatase MutT (NUDIX family)|uniref:NUDIX hydrolase n=1 Tax=Rhodococcus sp. PvR099 TaxID=2806602 RepID=UPI001AEB8DD5|nr:NUDIX domain-containing protein [Rhodococcus sp. PvR099]MBP1158752.1 8-oxo-dGTP pyrophosphatase MutT (NUDIX family) [Rhodococcus sp. PvR099]
MDQRPSSPSGDPAAPDEVVAVYDTAGAVIGTAPRSRVYAEGLWHASAGVLLRSMDGSRVYVHRRSLDKAVFAGMHDCVAGGVVDPGESPGETAVRELAEELGVTGVELSPIAQVRWDGRWDGKPLRCHLFAFEGRYDGPISHQASEIVDGWWWTDAELRAHLADPAWAFVPDTRALLAGYFA